MAEEETPSEGLTGSLFDRIKGFFAAQWEGFLAANPERLAETVKVINEQEKVKYEAGLGLVSKEGFTTAIKHILIPDDIQKVLLKIDGEGGAGNALSSLVLTLSYYIAYIGTHAQIAGALSAHKWNKEYRPTLPDVNSLILALYRDPVKEPEVREMLRQHGYSDPNIDTMFMASKTILSPDDYKHLFLRGEIDDATLNAGLKKYGYSDQEITHLKTLFYPIPSYPDLIKMAVREAFYPDYIEEYGLMEELPSQFLEFSQKQGLSEEWAKRFWASHWELPSIMQGFEMLHRDVIEEDDLDKLFMAVDIMPWWRDKLQAISYNPLTRVDVRRVFRMGIIGRDEVKRTYLDLGYDEEKAEWLTKFTEVEQSEPDRDLTKAEVLSSYSKLIIGKAEANDMLLDLGYSQDEVDVLISMKEYTILKEIKDREEKRIRKYYLAGAYNANQAIIALGKLDLVGAEQESILKLWDSEKLAKLKSPSKSELDKLFQNRIIKQAIYVEEMKHLGYTDKYIGWYLALIAKAGKG